MTIYEEVAKVESVMRSLTSEYEKKRDRLYCAATALCEVAKKSKYWNYVDESAYGTSLHAKVNAIDQMNGNEHDCLRLVFKDEECEFQSALCDFLHFQNRLRSYTCNAQ